MKKQCSARAQCITRMNVKRFIFSVHQKSSLLCVEVTVWIQWWCCVGVWNAFRRMDWMRKGHSYSNLPFIFRNEIFFHLPHSTTAYGNSFHFWSIFAFSLYILIIILAGWSVLYVTGFTLLISWAKQDEVRKDLSWLLFFVFFSCRWCVWTLLVVLRIEKQSPQCVLFRSITKSCSKRKHIFYTNFAHWFGTTKRTATKKTKDLYFLVLAQRSNNKFFFLKLYNLCFRFYFNYFVHILPAACVHVIHTLDELIAITAPKRKI